MQKKNSILETIAKLFVCLVIVIIGLKLLGFIAGIALKLLLMAIVLGIIGVILSPFILLVYHFLFGKNK